MTPLLRSGPSGREPWQQRLAGLLRQLWQRLLQWLPLQRRRAAPALVPIPLAPPRPRRLLQPRPWRD